MRIGVVVDGESEFRSLPLITRGLATPSTIILDPLRADIQPFATVGQIAVAVSSRLAILAGRGAEKAIILVDRETRGSCPRDIAAELINAVQPVCARVGVADVGVVVKNRTYENWLIADVGGITAIRGRFRLTRGVIREIENDGADRQDGIAILKRAARKEAYTKVSDSVRIMSRANPLAIAGNSRSFRRFLRLLNHPVYADQSRRPA